MDNLPQRQRARQVLMLWTSAARHATPGVEVPVARSARRIRHPERWLTPLTLRLPPAALARLEALARAEGEALATVGRAVLLRGLDAAVREEDTAPATGG